LDLGGDEASARDQVHGPLGLFEVAPVDRDVPDGARDVDFSSRVLTPHGCAPRVALQTGSDARNHRAAHRAQSHRPTDWRRRSSDELNAVLSTVIFVDEVLLLAVALYYLLIALGGFWPFPESKKSAPPKERCPRFLCLTMAHDEEAVIGEHVRNLLSMDYPQDRFDVVVVADNCTDRTAEIARDAGATVWKRRSMGERGKGHALRWTLYERADLTKYDAVCVADADNLMDPNFLEEMARCLNEGHEVIQAYLDTKNPRDTWVSASYAAAYWYMNRFWQRARIKWGLSGALGGTGLCIKTSLLSTLPWQARSLTEDLEYSTQVLLSGRRVYWTPNTRVYDEKPLTLKQSLPQRTRWLRGHWSTAFHYSPQLLRALLRGSTRSRFRAFDYLVYLWQPVVILLTGLNVLLVPVQLLAHGEYDPWLAAVLPVSIWLTIVGVGLLLPLLAFALEDAPWFIFAQYPVFLLFNLTWIPVAVLGLVQHRDLAWSHTTHTRSLSYEELEAGPELMDELDGDETAVS
jgi:cellulose synthase/poly-beta-1,6-N-acetylglucosamine synthase-like glycosyltransferase